MIRIRSHCQQEKRKTSSLHHAQEHPLNISEGFAVDYFNVLFPIFVYIFPWESSKSRWLMRLNTSNHYTSVSINSMQAKKCSYCSGTLWKYFRVWDGRIKVNSKNMRRKFLNIKSYDLFFNQISLFNKQAIVYFTLHTL